MPPDIDTNNVSIIENLGSIITILVFAYVGLNIAMERIGGIFIFLADIIYYVFVLMVLLILVTIVLRYIEYMYVKTCERFTKKYVNITLGLIGVLGIITIHIATMYTWLEYEMIVELYYDIFWGFLELIER
jgi:hypothetical protein